MLSILKKPTPVEVIHAEFDSAQDRILDECDKILAELQIPTETQIEKKASIMEELGFINSEIIQQAKVLKERTQKIEQKINLTIIQAESIRYFKQKYPFEKFITVDELNRICEKYNLIHAPVSNYIKDIPEKNVNEMLNCTKLDVEDKYVPVFQVELHFYGNLWGYESKYCEKKEIKKLPKTIVVSKRFDYEHQLRNYLQEKYNIIGILPDDYIIIDPFLWSGTTALACKKYNRKFIWIELDKKYFDIAKQRILNS